MGQTESKSKIQEEFEIFRIEKDGNALLRSKKDNKEYLMRVVTCATVADMERLKALLECRAQLHSQHILSLVEIKQKQQDFLCSIHYKMYLVLEYSFKNLEQEMKERIACPQRNYFQQSDLWSILYSCCTALSTLYSNGATHESLSAEQIFINKDGFVKITEPLLFGLEKNHLEAMRAREEGTVNIHLSPEIIGCLDDQNFFYYDKQKSDIFVLAMIVLDLALLGTHYLYNPRRKISLVDELESLLEQVGERYSRNIVIVLGQMLQMESRLRPNLTQIIEKVEKYNNVNQDFTVESESNLRSNIVTSQRIPERVFVDRPIQIQQGYVQQQVLQRTRKRQPIYSNVFTTGGHSMQEQSLFIKQHSPSINNQNFEGRVFASTPHRSEYNQTLFTSHHQYVPAATYYQNSPPNYLTTNTKIQTTSVMPPPTNTAPPVYFRSNRIMSQSVPQNYVHPPPTIIQAPSPIIQTPPAASKIPAQPKTITTEKVIIANPPQNFNLYERSKSIDSIKITSNNEASRTDLIKGFPQSANKPITHIPIQPRQDPIKMSSKYEPIFTHEIPEVYNILVKNRQSQNNKLETFSKQEKQAISIQNEHVATPQFNGDIAKVNRFTSFKNYAFEVVSRSGEEPESPLLPGQPVEFKRRHSHTKSEQQSIYTTNQKTPPDPFTTSNAFCRNFVEFSTTPSKQPPNPFAGSTPHPEQAYPPKQPFSNSSAAGFVNSSPIVSASFIPPPPTVRTPPPLEGETFNYPSSYSHLAPFHKGEEVIQLEYVKEDIQQRGRYQGYKHNGERNGHGILYFKDGGHYDGQWKDDKMHGFGKLYYQNGKIAYQGHWQNDQFNGQGRVYNSQPVQFEHEFNYKDFSELGNQWTYYEGQFKNDSKHGKGYIKLANGEMFQGIFDHDMIQGNGIFYKRGGEIIVGFWIDNKLFLNQSYQHDKK